MKTRIVRSLVVALIAVGGLAITLGCLMPPMGPGDGGGRDREHGDRDRGDRGPDGSQHGDFHGPEGDRGQFDDHR